MYESLDEGVKLGGRSRLFQCLIIIFSGSVTILLGLDTKMFSGFEIWVKNLSVILSATVTAFHTWNTFSNYTQRAGQERRFINKLMILYKDIMLYKDGNENVSMERYTEYKDRYDKIQEEYLEERDPSEIPPEAPKT